MIEFYKNGIRHVNRVKGKHNCNDCQYLQTAKDGTEMCTAREKNSLVDTNFPYDNTKCSLFKEHENDE